VTLRDVGQQLGVSGERVRQLEARALAKLRAALRELGVGGGA
jgi:DNA-directed RNA polymerase sigma subunit (sigma70/sigma32)